MDVNPDIRYGDWRPVVETATETVDLTQVRKFANVLDLDEAAFQNGSELPPMWHWLFFLHRAQGLLNRPVWVSKQSPKKNGVAMTSAIPPRLQGSGY